MGIGKRMAALSTLGLWLAALGAAAVYAGAPAPVPTSTGPHAPNHQVANLGDFRFENGAVVKDFKVSYVTYGRLRPSKDNVILAMHHFYGDHHSFDHLIGPGKGLDTDKYFIVAPDFLGNPNVRDPLTTGPTNSKLDMAFPRYTLRDSLNADYKLLKEHLGFQHILAAAGISIGGMKVYQLAVSYPDYARGLIPMFGTPATNYQIKAVLESHMELIELERGWLGGRYKTNPRAAVDLARWSLFPWILTTQFFLGQQNVSDAYAAWRKGSRGLVQNVPYDARDYYYGLQSWAYFNVGDTPGFNGDTRAALATVKGTIFIIGARGDLLCTHAENSMAKEAIPNATYLVIDSERGHGACCGLDLDATKLMNQEIAAFLTKLQ